MKYHHRAHAGQVLAELLKAYPLQQAAIVLALPRGGVPVAYEIAKKLDLPLEVFIVRKLGVPGHEELAMGALASGGTMLLHEDTLKHLHISQQALQHVIEAEQKELARREQLYGQHNPFASVAGKTVILVDDGIATGATMKAAILALQKQKPAALIVAVPVAAHDACEALEDLVSQLICPLRPVDLQAVGSWYEDFAQTSDEEVTRLLKR